MDGSGIGSHTGPLRMMWRWDQSESGSFVGGRSGAMVGRWFSGVVQCADGAGHGPSAAGGEDAGKAPNDDQQLREIKITARRVRLLGTAVTASEGVVTTQELHLAPI